MVRIFARAAYVILVIVGFPSHVVMVLVGRALKALEPYAIDGEEKS